METPPLYLLLFFLKIRKHAHEVGYLKRRFEDMDLVTAIYEKSMLGELLDAHLIACSDSEDEVVFDQMLVEVTPGRIAHRSGTQRAVSVPRQFVILARGRYVWTEILTRYFAWALTAIVCGMAGGLAIEAEGDLLHAGVVAVLVGLALPVLACLCLVLTNPRA